MHLVRSRPHHGATRSPTVLIEAGCGWCSLMYWRLIQSIGERFPVVAYDRTGLGWSDDCGQEKDAEGAAARLSALLDIADITEPLFLVGHSIAGLYLRVFAARNPERVRGVAFLDASHPRQGDVLNTHGFPYLMRLQYYLMAAGARFGRYHRRIPDFILNAYELERLPKEARDSLAGCFSRPTSYLTALAESAVFDRSARQATEAGDFGDVPLLIFTAAKRPMLTAAMREDTEQWFILQEDLASLTTNSRHIILEEASHCSLITDAEHGARVSSEILDFIAAERIAPA